MRSFVILSVGAILANAQSSSVAVTTAPDAPATTQAPNNNAVTTAPGPAVTTAARAVTTAIPGPPYYPTSCSNPTGRGIKCLSSTTFNICEAGVADSQGTSSILTCGASTFCCAGKTYCDWDSTCGSTYNPATGGSTGGYVPNNGGGSPQPTATAVTNVNNGGYNPGHNTGSCANKANDKIACISDTQFKVCTGGVAAYDTLTCQPGLRCFESLNRCDWSTGAINGGENTNNGGNNGGYVPGPIPHNTGSCANKLDNYIACVSDTTFKTCTGGAPAYGTQSCQAGLTCYEATNSCGWTGGYTPGTGAANTGTCTNKVNNAIACISDTQFQVCTNGAPAYGVQSCQPGLHCYEATNSCGWTNGVWVPGSTGSTVIPFTSGPTKDFCDTQTHDYDHMGKFCVGVRSNMWCKDGELSRINFCPSDQICCENSGECGTASKNCYVPKGIPTRKEGCVGKLNSCADLADGARVCTGDKTFSYCLDQTVFAPLIQNCPAGTKCIPELGGRCEEDGLYPTQPVGHCDDQPDGATVCNGYKSYKVCHNGGCLGTFDCIGDDNVCCPITGSCAPKGQCDSTTFWPVVDENCLGSLNKRVCTVDKDEVHICLNGHLVAKFPAAAGYNFGCDDDVLFPDSTLYN
ncbi:UNVERIFIED_CONTAM: hypothetical protein HDU68_007700 [Siphonaria sp. JEL0065]|nr:hypothetical protein HDU68_007700 [Siphonaria sp. JEL0065]